MRTIRELAARRVQEHGMTAREARSMLDVFARTGEGGLIGWEDIAPRLSRDQAALIDRAAVGYRLRNGAPEEPPPHDGKAAALPRGDRE